MKGHEGTGRVAYQRAGIHTSPLVAPERTLQRNRSKIEATFEASSKKVFHAVELAALVDANRDQWGLPPSMRWRQVAEFLADAGKLVPLEVRRAPAGKNLTGPSAIRRYGWGSPSAFSVALSLRPDSYLSHASAVFLRGLSRVLPAVVYANQEQSPKPVPAGRLRQESIDRAFANAPRMSNHVFIHGDQRIVLLSGKATSNLQVGEASYAGETLPTTMLERTLIDIAVRPVYAGGVGEVLRAYRSARDIVSVPLLVKTLARLDYVYPYEQVVGFYLERAGYPHRALNKLEGRSFKFDFYLTNQIKERAYSSRWRLFYPKGF